MLSQLQPVVAAAELAATRDDLPGNVNGIYIEVSGRAGEPLAAASLERRREGMELLRVREQAETVRATVFMPTKGAPALERLVSDYRTKERGKNGEAANWRLVESIAQIRVATLQDLWVDDPAAFPKPGLSCFWEVWLRPGTAAAARFRAQAEILGLPLGPSGLVFPEALAVRVTGTREQMAELSDRSVAVALVRRASTTAEFFDSLPAGDQYSFSRELLGRVSYQPVNSDAVRVCLLDTGVNRGHALLAQVLDSSDCFAVGAGWGSDDHHGHGTELAGVALFGDLVSVLDSHQPVDLPHRLESVKIIPPKGELPYDLLGAVTRDGIELVEMLESEKRTRVFCLSSSTTEDTPHFGLPTSWSSELDQLAAGLGSFDGRGDRRLICVAAGNLRDPGPTSSTYPSPRNDAGEIESPAQAWNCLTSAPIGQKWLIE